MNSNPHSTLGVPATTRLNGMTVFSVVLCSAGLAALWPGIMHPGSQQQFLDLNAGAVAAGAGLGLFAAAQGWFDWTGTISTRFYYTLGLVLAACIGLLTWTWGMHQIGGFDDSAIIDVVWRAYSGQVPYTDFPNAFPVFFILGGKLAFSLFGVSWNSLATLNALCAFVTFVWSLWLLTELLGRRWTNLLWAVFLQSQTNASTAFWAYGPLTGVACVLYMLSAVLWLRRTASIAMAASCFLSVVLLAGLKPNSSGPLLLLVSAILFFSSPHRLKVVVMSVAAFAVFYVVLRCNGVGLGDMIKNYLSVSGRLLSLRHFLVFGYVPFLEYGAYSAAGLAALVPGCAIIWWMFSHDRPLLWKKETLVAIATFVVGIFGYIVNSSHYCDICVMLFAAMLLVAELPRPSWNRYVPFVCVVLTAGGLAAGASRDYVKHSGIPMFFQYDGDSQTVETGFFKGVQCGNVFVEMLKEEADVVARGGSIWFGPSMQWGYAAYNLPALRQQPVFWEPDTSFASADEEMYFKRFLDSKFETLILFKNCFSKYSQAELARLGEAYDVDQSLQALTILHLKK